MASSTYIVRQGDSFWSIATNHGITLSQLIAANPRVTNPALIYPGQVINIPNCMPPQPEPVPCQTPRPTPTIPPTPTTPGTNLSNDFPSQVIRLINEQRVENGVQPLTVNSALMNLAHIKSQDMYDNNYFSHVSPTFGTPFEMLRAAGVSYSVAGENIARGQQTPSAVVMAWMNSPGHRANILSDRFTETGVGFVDSGTPIWTQLFLRP